jgi:hypothetical protein
MCDQDVRPQPEGENLNMDEANIVKVLQDDLENYQVKIQTRCKESQLHVLITREEGDDLDYGKIYDIVKHRIDSLVNTLAIDGCDHLTVYGRISGARHPEWQKSAAITVPLPVIELDLDDLEDVGNLENLGDMDVLDSHTFVIPKMPATSNGKVVQEIAGDNLLEGLPEYDSFKKKLEEDLISSSHNPSSDFVNPTDIVSPSDPDFDFDAVNSALDEISQAARLNSNSSSQGLDQPDLDQYAQGRLFPIVSVDDSEVLLEQPSVNGSKARDEDFSFDGTTVPLPRPLPPPPTKYKVAESRHKESGSSKSVKTLKPVKPPQTLPIASIAFVSISIIILGACGWLIWERSQQQKYLEKARELQNQTLSTQNINDINELTETRNQIQTTVAKLEMIPNTPLSLYASAQTELDNLKPKLQEFDQRVTLEQEANKKLELAKNETFEAAKLVQNPPHNSKIWKSAQTKRQEALKVLEQITPDSLLYADAQRRITTYKNELAQISRWLDIQTKAESLVPTINPAAIAQLKGLKAKAVDKAQFLSQCQPILQPQLNATDAQNLGISMVNLAGYLCAYVWD